MLFYKGPPIPNCYVVSEIGGSRTSPAFLCGLRAGLVGIHPSCPSQFIFTLGMLGTVILHCSIIKMSKWCAVVLHQEQLCRCFPLEQSSSSSHSVPHSALMLQLISHFPCVRYFRTPLIIFHFAPGKCIEHDVRM